MLIGRRAFLGAAGAVCAAPGLFGKGAGLSSKGGVRFLVLADIHHDLIPDAPARLEKIQARAKAEKVDFIVQLGDFCFAKPGNESFKTLWNSIDIPRWHVLGNHDMDRATKAEFTAFWGIPSNYYTFDYGKFRFVALDSNFFEADDGTFRDYSKGNYASRKKLDCFGEEQCLWLEKQLKDRSKIFVFFSHAPINDAYSKIKRNQRIHSIILKAKRSGTRIVGAFAGHNHSDNYHCVDGINYQQINSASYVWGGGGWTNTSRYPAEVYKKYDALKYTGDYVDPLSAVIELDPLGRVKLTGVSSTFVPPAPSEKLLKSKPYPCSASIENRAFSF